MSRCLDKFLQQAKTPIKPFPEGIFFFFLKGKGPGGDIRIQVSESHRCCGSCRLLISSCVCVLGARRHTPPAADN